MITIHRLETEHLILRAAVAEDFDAFADGETQLGESTVGIYRHPNPNK